MRVSLRALAKRLDVSPAAVQKAVRNGRLHGSVGRDDKGRPFISDADLAAREWAERSSRAPSPGVAAQPGPRPKGNGASGASLADAQRTVALQRAEGLRLSNLLRSGELVRRDAVERDAFEAARVVRDNVLNVPDRVSAELAGESDAHRIHARLTLELTKALEHIAGILDRDR